MARKMYTDFIWSFQKIPTSSLLHPGRFSGSSVIPFLLKSRVGEERALAERIKS